MEGNGEPSILLSLDFTFYSSYAIGQWEIDSRSNLLSTLLNNLAI